LIGKEKIGCCNESEEYRYLNKLLKAFGIHKLIIQLSTRRLLCNYSIGLVLKVLTLPLL
jgi:hypothetical protein